MKVCPHQLSRCYHRVAGLGTPCFLDCFGHMRPSPRATAAMSSAAPSGFCCPAGLPPADSACLGCTDGTACAAAACSCCAIARLTGPCAWGPSGFQGQSGLPISACDTTTGMHTAVLIIRTGTVLLQSWQTARRPDLGIQEARLGSAGVVLGQRIHQAVQVLNCQLQPCAQMPRVSAAGQPV